MLTDFEHKIFISICQGEKTLARLSKQLLNEEKAHLPNVITSLQAKKMIRLVKHADRVIFFLEPTNKGDDYWFNQQMFK